MGQQIKHLIKSATSDYDKEKLQERLAKLTGGVAVLKVGGASEVEVQERTDRVQDAVRATQAAVEEGTVPGGGVSLLYAAEALKDLKVTNVDQQAGVDVIAKSLTSPIKQ